jgi:hypothetical protein
VCREGAGRGGVAVSTETSDEFDERIDQVIKRHAQRVQREDEEKRLVGLAKAETERRRVKFLSDFSLTSQRIILPAFRHVEQKISTMGDGSSGEMRASVSQSDNGPTLRIYRNNRVAVLILTADPRREMICAQSDLGKGLELQPLSDADVSKIGVERLIARFAERAVEEL